MEDISRYMALIRDASITYRAKKVRLYGADPSSSCIRIGVGYF